MADDYWIDKSRPFLIYLDQWFSSLPKMHLSNIAPSPEKVAIASVDLINGFCYQGPLSSPRIAKLIKPVVSLLEKAWGANIHHILLFQDSHDLDAIEFAQFPPHCVRGTLEAETIPEILALPFSEHIKVFGKNSIHSGLNTGLTEWMSEHSEVDTFIVVGDCTDLCTYQLAMHLRMDANANQRKRRVLLPVNCVDTYDLAVPAAKEAGAVPHDAELLHRVFLYSMMLNGIEVIAKLI